jgi:hypothetical protein
MLRILFVSLFIVHNRFEFSDVVVPGCIIRLVLRILLVKSDRVVCLTELFVSLLEEILNS